MFKVLTLCYHCRLGCHMFEVLTLCYQFCIAPEGHVELCCNNVIMIEHIWLSNQYVLFE